MGLNYHSLDNSELVARINAGDEAAKVYVGENFERLTGFDNHRLQMEYSNGYEAGAEEGERQALVEIRSEIDEKLKDLVETIAGECSKINQMLMNSQRKLNELEHLSSELAEIIRD